jgi:serine protease inhibitor
MDMGLRLCVPRAPPPPPKPTVVDVHAVIGDAITALFDFTRALLATRPRDTNVVVSPASLQTALCATALAATPGSATEAQLLRLFGASATSTEDALLIARATGMLRSRAGLDVATALFTTRHALKPEFVTALQHAMGAHVATAHSAADVNAWCAEHTRGAIRELLPPSAVTADTALLLVNAVLFRGAWAHPFDAADTREGDWDADGPHRSRVPLMYRHYARHAEQLLADDVGGGARARVVCVPYSDNAIEAWFVLPAERGSAALDAVGDALPQLWADMARLYRAREVELTVPRFALDAGCVDVVPALRALGVAAPFDAAGGFLAATADGDARVSAVLQRTTCMVDEAGTVAAACTAVGHFATCSGPGQVPVEKPPPFVVQLNRPFWLVIAKCSEDTMYMRVPMYVARVVSC